ncbi:MAG: alpha/beta hydrolase [bacterium]|nr:alpha/beta hydrolase [bacterium]
MIKFLITLLLAWAGCGLFLYLLQEKLIFLPQPTPPENRDRFAPHELTIDHNDITLHGWFVHKTVSKSRPLIIYYGGNAEEASHNLWELEPYPTDSFLFMNYRGYGRSQGRPGEKALCKDALFIFDYIVATYMIDPDHIILIGRSLGTGVAAHVAHQRQVRGIILITPFDSLADVAQKHYPVFPVKLMLRHPFNSAALAPDIKTPALILVAADDEIVPPKSAYALAERWGGAQEVVTIENATHNDIQNDPRYWEAINRFIARD